MLEAMQIPERYHVTIDPLIAHARRLLESGESLAALAFVVNLAKHQITPVVLDDSTEESKDSSARAISMTAAMTGADFIFQVREGWTLSPQDMPRYEEIVEEYGSIGASPYAQDVAVFSLETTHGTWIASPAIKPLPPERRTFGPVVFEHMPGVQGRFVGLLKKENEDGTLH